MRTEANAFWIAPDECFWKDGKLRTCLLGCRAIVLDFFHGARRIKKWRARLYNGDDCLFSHDLRHWARLPYRSGGRTEGLIAFASRKMSG